MAAPAYTIDRSNYPQVEITWDHTPTSDDLAAYFADLDALLAQAKRITLLFRPATDIRWPPEQRLQMARWLKLNEQILRRYVSGLCFVTSSTIFGVFLRAIFIFAPPPQPYKITSSDSEGKSWCRSIASDAERLSRRS